MSIACELDQTVHVSREALHQHLRGKLKQETYYLKYHPRFDLADGRPIPFKNVEQYLSQDFVDKNSMNRWLKADSAAARTWAIDWLVKRRVEKNLIYAPSEVELRTLMAPSMAYYSKIVNGGYYSKIVELGFQPRYTDEFPRPIALPNNATIICDTREKTPLKLSIPTIIDTLNVGDYALGAAWDKGIRIERKSLSDFCGTLSDRDILDKEGNPSGQTPLRRFDAELARAEKAGLYVVMAIEVDINSAQSFDYLPYMRHVKASPAYIFKNLRDLLVKYPLTFQAIFIDGRVEMAIKIHNIFQLGEQVKRLDLQWLLAKGEL